MEQGNGKQQARGAKPFTTNLTTNGLDAKEQQRVPSSAPSHRICILDSGRPPVAAGCPHRGFPHLDASRRRSNRFALDNTTTHQLFTAGLARRAAARFQGSARDEPRRYDTTVPVVLRIPVPSLPCLAAQACLCVLPTHPQHTLVRSPARRSTRVRLWVSGAAHGARCHCKLKRSLVGDDAKLAPPCHRQP